MRQEIDRATLIPARQDAVWEKLLDFRTVASWLSIVGDVREVDPGKRYAAMLEDRVGPFALRADLDVRVSAERPVLRVEASGEDRQVASRITAHVDVALADDGDGTRVGVTGAYDITGRIATLGAGAIRKKGERVLDEFVASLTRAFGSA